MQENLIREVRNVAELRVQRNVYENIALILVAPNKRWKLVGVK